MKQIIIATKNKGKAIEFHDFFQRYGIQAISLLEISKPIPDVAETGTTFSENAAIKAKTISDILQVPVLADDSGLIVDALDGRPGVYSARYAGENKDDKANIQKVLEELKDIPMDKRTARFHCVLAIKIPGKEIFFRTGSCEGKIAFMEKGQFGFGYDPIFIPDGYTETMAELKPEVKNAISHRKKAMDQLAEWLQSDLERENGHA